MQARAEQLATLLPDMLTRLECTRADILMPLLQDLPGLTEQLIGIRECLPGVNVSALAAKHPRLLQVRRWGPRGGAQKDVDTDRLMLPYGALGLWLPAVTLYRDVRACREWVWTEGSPCSGGTGAHPPALQPALLLLHVRACKG